MLLNELSILVVEVVQCSTLIALLLSVLQNLLDSLDLRQIELLEESVEGCATLSPILGLARG